MRRWLLLLALLCLLAGQISAAEVVGEQAELFGVEELEKAVPDEAESLLGKLSPTEQLNVSYYVSEIISGALQKSEGVLRSAAGLMLRILLIVILCHIAETGTSMQVSHAVTMAGALALLLCCVKDLRSMISAGVSSMEEIMNFSNLLMPVMASAATAVGAPGGAGAVYAIAVFFSNLLVNLCGRLLPPLIYGYLALSLADAAVRQNRLARLRELLAGIMKWSLKGVMYLFTGFLAVSGVLTGHSDAMALKAAKLTISGMVPVVGGIISDAAETVLAGAGLIRGAVGTYGMLAVLAVFAMPFLRLAIHYLAFRLTSVLSGLISSDLCGMMDSIGTATGLLMAMLGSGTLMCLMSCCCFMRLSGL